MIGKDICLKIQGNGLRRVFLSPQDEGPTVDGTESLNRAYFFALFYHFRLLLLWM